MNRTLLLATGFAVLLSAAASAADLTTPAIDGVVAAGTPIEIVREDFKGTEGPVALPDGSLLFTENQAARVTRIAPDGSDSVFLTHPSVPNALAINRQGELVAVLTGKPGVAVIHPADKARTLVDSADGKPLNRPNDLVIGRNGGIYFTDPGGRTEPGRPTPPPAIYYLNPAGKLLRLAVDIVRPNGIQLSPDEATLYVAAQGEYVIALTVSADGSGSGRRDFARLAGFRQTEGGPTSGADGLAVDAEGRLYVATTVGVQIFARTGAALGVIALPKAPQNLAFAGQDKRTLYVVGRGAVYRIRTLAQGYTGRAK